MASPPAHGDPPVILIGGPARCGKSLFAAALAREIGGHAVRFDKARETTHDAPPGRLRKVWKARACLDTIGKHFKSHSDPLIIEGTGLVHRRAQSAREGLELLLFLRSYIGCRAFTLGCADDDVEEKAEAIARYALEHKDWLHSDAGGHPAAVARLAWHWAARAVEESRWLQEWSGEAGIPHLSMRSRYFEDDLKAALRIAMAQLSCAADAAEGRRKLFSKSKNGDNASARTPNRDPWLPDDKYVRTGEARR